MGAGQEPPGGGGPAVQLQRDHAAEGRHLFRGDIVSGVCLQPGVVHLRHLRLLHQPVGQVGGVLAVAVHADGQRLHAAEGQVGVERPRHAAGRVLEELDRGQQVVAADHRPADHVRVPAQVLGGAVNHDVRPVFERPLEVAAGEGVVHHQDRPVLVAQLGQGGDVQDLQQRVRRRFDPDHPRFWGHEGGEADRRGVVGVTRRQSPRLEHLVQQAEGAAVQVGRRHHLVAGLEQPLEHGRGRGQAAGEGHAPFAAFEGRQTGFQGGAGGVAAAAVLVPLVLAGGGLGVGAGGVDGHHRRPGGRVGRLAGVDGPCAEAVGVGHRRVS